MARLLEQHRTAWAIALGVLGACFFSSTFLINRQLALGGGHWIWTASLRFLFTAALLAGWLQVRGELTPILRFFRASWATWVRWGTIGFGGFYTMACIAADFSPGWLVAGAFQLNLVAGLLLAPLIYRDERRVWNVRALRVASIVVVGTLLMQVENVAGGVDAPALLGFGLMLVAAVCYPLGNRKIILFLETRGPPLAGSAHRAAPARLSALQIVFGMTLGSVPYWLVLAAIGAVAAPPPSAAQAVGTLAVALFAGIIATGLFYAALGLAGRNGTLLGAVESTQSVELLATVLVEVAFLGAAMPSFFGLAGSALVMGGIVRYARLR